MERNLEMKKLYTPLKDETEYIKEKVKESLRTRFEPYEIQYRGAFDGPSFLNSALSCREDFYAIAFLY